MAITRVQGKQSANSGAGAATTVSITLNATVGSGNCVCGVVSWESPGATLNSVTDDKGNTYNLETVLVDSGFGQQSQAFSRTNITNGPITVTGNFSTNAAFNEILADEFSGTSTASTDERDGAAHGGQVQDPSPGNGTDAVTSGNFTTSTNGDLIYGVATNTANTNHQAAHGTNFTDAVNAAGAGPLTQSEYLVQSTAGTGTAATFTQSTGEPWITFLIAIKAAGAAAAQPSGSSDYYSAKAVQQGIINGAQAHLLAYESLPSRSFTRPSGESAFYDVDPYPRLRFRDQHDAYATKFVQQNPPPGSGGFSWYFDRAVYPQLRFRDQHETYPARGLVPSPSTPSGASVYYDVEVYPKLRFRDQHDSYPARSIAVAAVPSGSVSFFDFDRYPALQFRHQHEGHPARGLVPTAASPLGWAAFYDVEVVARTKAALADHESAEFTFYPSRPLWADFYDAEVIKPRARDYIDAPSPATQAAAVIATGWGAFYDSNLNLLPPRRAAEGAIYDAETPETLVAFVDFGAYYDRARLRPVLTQQHETYPARGLVPTAATPQGWWLPFDVARARPVPTSLQQFDGYQHFIPPVAVNLGPLGWSMFWDKGKRPLSADRMPFLFEQLYQTPTATTPQGWTHNLDLARIKAFPAALQQHDGLQRLSFVPPFITLPGDWYDVRIVRPRARDYQVIDRPMFFPPPFPFDQVDVRVIRPRAFPYSVVDQQPTVVVPPSAYVLFPDLFKRQRPFPYLTWPEQRVAVLNTPAGTGGPTYFYDRRLFVAHRPVAEVVPFDGRGLPFVVVNLIIHRPGKGGLLTPVLLAATKGQPTLAGIQATPTLGGEVED